MEKSLSSLTFTDAEHGMVRRSARSMRLMGSLYIAGGVVGLIALGILGFMLIRGDLSVDAQVPSSYGDLYGGMAVVGWTLGALTMLLMVWGGWLLQGSASALDAVVETDLADQDYLAVGLRMLRTFFVLSGTLAVLSAMHYLFNLFSA